MRRVSLVFGCTCAAAAAAVAEPVRMTGEDIKRAMPGALLEIDTPLGITIPVKVSHDGLLSAEAGALGLTLGARKDRGRWWTDGDKLCAKWFRWFDAKARCMSLVRDGNRVVWREDSGETGTATLTEAAPVVAARQLPAMKPAAKVQRAAVRETSPSELPVSRELEQPRLATASLGMLPSLPERPALSAVAKETAAKPASGEPPPILKHAETPRVAVSTPTPPRAPERRITGPAPRVAQDGFRYEPVYRVAGVEAGDTLNVRSGPSEYHQALGAIPADGRMVRITGTCRELWCPVRHGRLKGWVNRYYLAEDSSARPYKAATRKR